MTLLETFQKVLRSTKASVAEVATVEEQIRDELARVQREIAATTDNLVMNDTPEGRETLRTLQTDAELLQRRLKALQTAAAEAKRREALAAYTASCKETAALFAELQTAKAALGQAQQELRSAEAVFNQSGPRRRKTAAQCVPLERRVIPVRSGDARYHPTSRCRACSE